MNQLQKIEAVLHLEQVCMGQSSTMYIYLIKAAVWYSAGSESVQGH